MPFHFAFSLFSHLNLETSGAPATTGLLELATLGLDVWFLKLYVSVLFKPDPRMKTDLVLVWAESEMLDSLSGVLGSSQE